MYYLLTRKINNAIWTAMINIMRAIGIVFCLLFNTHFLYAQSAQHSSYLLGSGDILEISVWKDDSLTKQVVILPDGTISFPLVGVIKAAGRTIENLQDEIAKKLSEYISEPVVTIMVIKVNSYNIYVLGKVNKPGAYSLGQKINVMQALALAGGLNAFADADDIGILREVDGKQVKIKFNYKEVIKGKNLEQNITLKAGDIIVVP